MLLHCVCRAVGALVRRPVAQDGWWSWACMNGHLNGARMVDSRRGRVVSGASIEERLETRTLLGSSERAAQHGSTADGSAGADWRRWAQTACATRLLCQLHFPTTVPVCPQLPCPRPFAITCAVPNEAPAPSRSPNTCVAAKLTHCASPILVPRSQTETACAQLLSPKNTHTRNSPPNHSSQWVSARLPCCLCQARQACVLRDFVVTSLLALP
jgi:hypothetical protein